jgi:hypothetical protein
MRAIVDSTVLNASTYYNKYKSEASPAGDYAIDPINTTTNISLEQVLAEAKLAGAGGELLVVSHSDPKGLKMKLVTGGSVSAMTGSLQTIMKVMDGIKQREAIGKLSSEKQEDAWIAWFASFDPGIKIERGFETADAEKLADQWLARQAANLGTNGTANLLKLLKLIGEVRALKLKRVEFRACRIGTDATALAVIQQIFGATKVVAPKEVRTFYGVISKVDQLTLDNFLALSKRPHSRVFSDMPLAYGFAGLTAYGYAPTMIFDITEHSFTVKTWDAKIWPSAFIKHNVLSTFVGATAPFIVGGLEPAGQAKIAGKPQVFPLEREYKSLLAVLDTTPAVVPAKP